jgi:small subunit ribosomal protein S20
MPSTKSATKRLRQSVERRAQNRSLRSEVRTQCKKVREAIKAADVEKAETEFRMVCKKLDQAASRRIVHRNAVARLKSRMSAKIKALKQS